MNYRVFNGLGRWVYGYLLGGASVLHNMLGLGQAMHVHVLGRHVQCINSYGIVMTVVLVVGIY